ncbi:PepSY-associated TM helix domain-containing protein [Marinobacterium jannaschii]|uniref:PepSY-associated TM helix domain-containing protein n=1 Tax=Marinobacterium jannaschii TaxID=64970 RepID=UPI0004827B7C|nr:PepSY-associated TM helix domain-containing protein [Marinobacterium jannaschii]
MTANLYRWHRRLALWVLLPLLFWGLSGLLHPLMRLTRPEAATPVYIAPAWPAALQSVALQPLLEKQSIDAVHNLRPVKLGDDWLLQVIPSVAGPGRMLEPLKAEVVEGGNRDYAIQLARHFSGLTQIAVTKVTRLDQFSAEYPPINRLLPVWRVEFADPRVTTAFVDIRQDRLGAISDDRRRSLMGLFQTLHVWSFVPPDHWLRSATFIGLMLMSSFIGLSGLYLYTLLPFRQRKQPQHLHWLHRLSGLIISIPLLMFTLSGLVRTLEKQLPDIRGIQLAQSVPSMQLDISLGSLMAQAPGINGVQLHNLDGQLQWQLLRLRQPALWLEGSQLQPRPDGERRFAQQLVAKLGLSSASPLSARPIRSYRDDPDYGFIDKRLPVMALAYPGQTLYIDSRDALLAKQVTAGDQLFGWVFRYLHKWRFANSLGLNGRDSLIALAIGLISASAVTGGLMWLRRKRKQRRAHNEKRPQAVTV